MTNMMTALLTASTMLRPMSDAEYAAVKENVPTILGFPVRIRRARQVLALGGFHLGPKCGQKFTDSQVVSVLNFLDRMGFYYQGRNDELTPTTLRHYAANGITYIKKIATGAR